MGGITIDSEYACVLIPAAAIAVQCLFTGFIAGGPRRKLFSKEFMTKYFQEEHKKAFNEDAPPEGYPDMGNGRYSEKLSYKEWYDFNNRQRAHYNFLEHLGIIIPLLCIAGIGYPVVVGWLGWAYFVGRIVYTAGYVIKGPKGRLPGAGIADVAFIAVIVYTVLSLIKLSSGSK